jgi:hypothetical protein
VAVNVTRVTEPAPGGHFAPFDEPAMYAAELPEFSCLYRTA